MTPIQLHTYGTPNGHKASIMLEEVGLPYEVHLVDIERGDQKKPGFLALNPNGKIPVIVDPDRARILVESGAILHYLAERSGRLLPSTEQERTDTLSWTLFQAAHIGPTLGQLWHYTIFAPEPIPAAVARFTAEARRVLRVLDARLTERSHIAGEAYGIADVMTWPWIRTATDTLALDIEATPHLARWFAAVGKRPAVQRGIAIPAKPHA